MKLEPITRANRPERKEVLMNEDEAADLIKDGDVVIVGGFGTVKSSDADYPCAYPPQGEEPHRHRRCYRRA